MREGDSVHLWSDSEAVLSTTLSRDHFMEAVTSYSILLTQVSRSSTEDYRAINADTDSKASRLSSLIMVRMMRLGLHG